ncbi:MAG: transcriptional repressor [Pseudohongiellaceae bacterium]
MVCTKCGKVEEFYDEIIEQQQEKAAKKLDFEITDHSLYLYGICKDCKSI